MYVNKLLAHLLHVVYNDIKGEVLLLNSLKAYVGEELWLHSLLTSVLDAAERNITPQPLKPLLSPPLPWKNHTGTPEIGGWVGPRFGLDFLRTEKYFSPKRIRTPDCIVINLQNTVSKTM